MYLGDKPWMKDIVYDLAAVYCLLSLVERMPRSQASMFLQ